MDQFLDALGGLALAVVTWLSIEWRALKNRVTAAHQRVSDNETAIAVLKSHIATTPTLLREIKDEIHGMRQEAKADRAALFAHVDDVRKELSRRIDGKVDKA